ncbi:MAG: aquaporin [Planctomycetales bacterium]|nr:aquaporin [Planctomycetales bacterium]MBN8625181.1 aquaporin [Planctomycetota bacterium]
MEASLSRKCAAEFLGTFALVFSGTGAVVANLQSGSVTHVGISLVFGLVVFALIQTFGDVSGCHINPAVTIAFVVARRFAAAAAIPYVAAQCLGAVAASALLRVLFEPNFGTLGATLPSGSQMQSWVYEFLLTAGLMYTVLSVSVGAKEKGITAGLAIGAVVGLEALFAGPICGASMNPARSLGPALVSGRVAELWIYLTAPVAGAIAAVPLCRIVRGKE